MAGLHLLVNISFLSLTEYVICSIWYISFIFSVHILYVGGSGFNHLIVMHLMAVASSMCTRYVLALPSISFGNRPCRATIGSIGIFPSNTSFSVSNTSSQNVPTFGHDQNMWIWLPMCGPQFLQHLFEYVVPNLAVISGVRKNLVIAFHLNFRWCFCIKIIL